MSNELHQLYSQTGAYLFTAETRKRLVFIGGRIVGKLSPGQTLRDWLETNRPGKEIR